jgi:hypothetical protein
MKENEMAKSGAGGGIHSNKVVAKPVRGGAAREGITAGYSGQIGTALGDHVTDGRPANRAAEPMKTAAPYKSAMGNEVAAATVCGPGGSRTVHRSGSQAHHGGATAAVAKPGLPKDVHGFVGPERKS